MWPLSPRASRVPYLERIVHMQDTAVQDGRTYWGDPQCPALPQHPLPGAHRLSCEAGHHRPFLLSGASGHERLCLHHGCPRQHRTGGAVVDLGKDRDDLSCSEKQWGLSFPSCSPDTSSRPDPVPSACYLGCSPSGRSWPKGRRGHGYSTRIGQPFPEPPLEVPVGVEESDVDESLCANTVAVELPNHPQLREDFGQGLVSF